MRRSLWLTLTLIILATLTAVMAYRIRQANATTKAAAELVIEIREHLPIGTSRSEVEAYLDRKGVPHSYIPDLKGSPEYQHTEMAMVGGTSRTWLVRGDTQLLFKFNNQDRL